MRVSERVLTSVCVFLTAALTSSSLFAATLTKVNDEALAPLRAATLASKIHLDKLPLYDSKRSVIDLEEFQVWAPGAKVIIHGENGVVLERLDPPAKRFFRGLVNGNRESFAYFSVDVKTGKIDGLIDTSERKVAIASTRRAPTGKNRRGATDDQPFEYFLSEDDPFAVTPEMTWQCQIDKSRIGPPNQPIHATGLSGLPVTSQGISGTQSYSISVEIETDYEMYHTVASDNATTVTNYITNLSGAVSTIYNRDLKTNLFQSAIHVYTSVSDPWNATTASAGLDELGDYYHSVARPSGRTTSAVIMLSGKNIGSGIAWEGIICNSDFPNGPHWGGPYAWCGGIGNLGTIGFGSIPDVNTPPYTMPTGTQNFWPLTEYAHELGHNLGGHHTHCVQTSDAERIASGFTDGSAPTSASDQVDHCYAHEGLAGCFAGATDYLPGSQTTFKGTIMSYCQNVSPQATASRFTFGQPVEGSHNELDNYMLRSLGPLSSTGTAGFDGGSTNIVNGVGAFTISAITAPATAGANSTGNAASITASPSAGATYGWEITNGTITAGQGTSAITFTAGASGTVVLRATGYNTQLCGVTDTKSVAIGAAFNPPTNVVATATSGTNVMITWTAPVSAPGRYNIYRTTNVATVPYLSVGNTPNGASTSFNDTTAVANTSYMYRVRSADAMGANESGDGISNFDLATTITFTNAITPGVSTIKAVDLNELRTAVDKVRALGNTGPANYNTDPGTVTAGVTVKAQNIIELRTYLNVGRNNAGLASWPFTNPSPTAGSTVISAQDFIDIRNGVQ